ncbi:hypothetical protein BG006_003362, partial [Podila minutissima]
MTDNRLNLFCLVEGESTSIAFPVKASSTDTVGDLKNLIVNGDQAPAFKDVASKVLILWRVSIPIDDDKVPILLNSVTDKDKTKLGPATRLSKVFPKELPEETVHVITQCPPQVHAPVPARVSTPLSGNFSDQSRPGTPLSGDLRVDIRKIRDKFFATGSKHANFLDASYGEALSIHWIQDRVFSFWIYGPSTEAGDPVPERFRSNILLSVLDAMQAQDLTVFDVSGCGKTHSMIEVLCLQWGFYFNASKNDLGSDDLYRLADFVDDKTSENTVSANTLFAKNMTLLLFLSRLLILNYCLRVPGCRQTFSSARWALLQVCPNMFKDVFLGLFRKLYDQMKGRVILGSLRLVVDEAQILSDKSPTSFESSSPQSNLRPMLSPVLHGFRTTGDRGELTIIYSGTGLSIRTLHWAMSSGDGIKEYGSNIFPYVEFPGWAGPASVQSYVDRMKEHLPDDESQRMVDALIPTAGVDMLHKRLTGRFRPIVAAVEGIIKTGKPSWKDRARRGNLCGELNRLESKIADHPELFTSCSSLRETLGLFLYRYCLLDATEIVLENEVQLVEAAFGRIKIFGGTARTVLDEPFVLKATFNYFREKDPSLVSAAERAMLHSDNAS